MKKQMLKMLMAIIILLTGIEKTYGQFPEPDYIPVTVLVKLEVVPFVRIRPENPIELKREDNNSYNYKGQTKLTVYNNFPMQITAEIERAPDIEIADSYMCTLNGIDWGQSVSTTLTNTHLFGNPKELTLQTRLTNVNMAKVEYQGENNLLDVAQVTITIMPWMW